MVPPQALQIGPAWENGTPSFMQQGQVDWVAFGNTVWSASAAVLQRFASSGVQPVTYGAGLALASQFRLSDIGRQRMDQTMKSLPGVPGISKILWFGFGYQSFVRMMADTQLGLNTVALCSCLAEVHSEETAAWVLAELWKLNGYPEEYEPSHIQFLALIKACSGVVACSGFNSEVDRMTGHGRWNISGAMRSSRYANPGLKASNVRDIARALHGLFQITRGRVERITLVGQNECAFIAAFGHWLLDLVIYVEDDAGNILFVSDDDVGKEGVQVLVRYTEDNEPTALQQSTTYVLPRGTDLVSKDENSLEARWILRVPWDGCLIRTFGSTFRDLCGLAHNLGAFLGSTARIFAALARSEPHVADFSRERYIGFSQYSYGLGYVHTVISTFKELGQITSLQSTMERALDSSFEDACRGVEQAAQSLRSSCHCDLCSDRFCPDSDKPWGNCLLALALTVRHLVTDLACTDRDENLHVAIHGLQSYYTTNYTCYYNWVRDKEGRTLVGLAVGLATAADSDDILFPKSTTLLSNI
ncbi:MAG: hypothetical protein L6R40_008611 [Gallowayella cf. fulva]|nr:MAG: hypothetical protein L6R40_008611 [Xanthomendoza cf. fulva]